MASSPITSWWIDGETVADFIFLGSKITADGDCSHEIKRHLLLGREVMTNLDSILKSRDITLPTKVLLVKVLVFPVVMYGCESWTVKKAEHQRIDAFFSPLFIYYYFYFTILYWFCHTLTWICHKCTWVPNPEPPSHRPPRIISLGHPSAPAPSILYPVSNLD